MNSPTRLRVYLFIWAALLGLLALTFWSAHLRLGAFNAPINYAVAAAKAILVALFFMNLRRAGVTLVVFALAGLFGLALLFGLSAADFGTTHVFPATWHPPAP